MKALVIGKWNLGRSPSGGLTFLRFEFNDKPPLDLAIPTNEAEKIAEAILAQRILPKIN